MHFLTRQFPSWLLVLIMIFSTVQVTMAADDQASQGVNCHMSKAQLSDVTQFDNCPMQHDKQCQEHPGCAVQFSANALPVLNTILSTLRNITHLVFISDNVALLTQYPSLLKRPPKFNPLFC